ncbi:MAG: TerD family protein [Planctomycetaceae bacterium]|jgi:tellurium resistance protein TerD|nr:TerD family protein [Planctomycetaceae bacterium]
MQYKIVLEYSLLDNFGVAYLELSAFLLNEKNKVTSNNCFVHAGNTTSNNNAAKFDINKNSNTTKIRSETITIDINSIPSDIHKVVFTVTAKADNNTQHYIKKAKETGNCSLFNNDSNELIYYYDLVDTDFGGGLIFCEIVRSESGWVERLVVDGDASLLDEFAQIYGVEAKKVVLPPVPPKPEPAKENTQQITQLKNQITQSQQEIESLKQQLQLERTRVAKLSKTCNFLKLENSRLLEQQFKSSNLLPELLVLFSESLQYHSLNSGIRVELESCRSKLVAVQNLNSAIMVIDDLSNWWRSYSIENVLSLSFWRPDSWSRFEDKFPHHPITIKLKYFIK